jgi:hypothetical protein
LVIRQHGQFSPTLLRFIHEHNALPSHFSRAFGFLARRRAKEDKNTQHYQRHARQTLPPPALTLQTIDSPG